MIMMRDEPMDAPIPDKFEPSQYNNEALAEARKELAEIKPLGVAECDRRAGDDYKEELATRQKRKVEKSLHEQRYKMMLARVRNWTPPTDDHQEMAKFMVEQLEESIKHDCWTDAKWETYNPEPVRLTGREWKSQKIAQLQERIVRDTKHQEEEDERTASRNEWLAALRESLPAE